MIKTDVEVHEFFKNELHESLLPLENFRLKKVNKIRNYLIVAAILIIPVIPGILMRIPLLIVFSGFVLAIFLGSAYQTLEKMKLVLQRNFKSDVLPKLLEFMFHEFDYIPNQRIARSTLTDSLLISDEITTVEGEDFMRFRLGETGIMFCETTVFRLNKSDGPIFKGVFLVASFNKHFSSQTVVLPRNKVSLLGSIFKHKIFDIFHEIKLEDPDFTKEFIVFSTDQVDSRYILTTSLMNRILTYKEKVNRNISVSFAKDKMYCTIPNYINLFEPALFESFFDFSFMQKSYDALKLYTDIVDDLNLNVRVWTRA